jgi:tetratricopeptide (TPR) repeat protein
MKYLLLLALLFNQQILDAQITGTELDKLWQANTGNSKETALATLLSFEKKYPADEKVMFNRGWYEYNFEDNMNEALRAFSSAIKKDPKFVKAYLFRAKVFEKKGVYEKAIEDLNTAIALNKPIDNTAIYQQRAGFYYQLKDYKNAVTDYLKSIELNPQVSITYNDLSRTYRALGNSKEAEAILYNNLFTKVDQPGILYIFYGEFLVAEKRYSEAIAQYKKGFATTDPKNTYAEDFNTAATAAYKLKDLNQAAIWFNTAIYLDPKNINYLLNRASVGVDEKNWAQVKAYAEKALQLNSNNPMANMMMAVGLKNTGNSSQAQVYEDKAKRLDKEQNN